MEKNGTNGESVYQLAQRVDNFTGSELEFLDSVNGKDGADGADGKSAYEAAIENELPNIYVYDEENELVLDPETNLPKYLQKLNGL